MLSELDQVPLLRSTSGGLSTIQTYLFPIIIIELGQGFVIGSDKILTKVSGTFRKGGGVPYPRGASKQVTHVYVYEECLEVAVVRAGVGPVTQGVRIRNITCSLSERAPTLCIGSLSWARPLEKVL